jgi:hypothetical protein
MKQDKVDRDYEQFANMVQELYHNYSADLIRYSVQQCEYAGTQVGYLVPRT